MNLAPVAFRLRVVVFLLIYFLGLFMPWSYLGSAGLGTVWLAASTLIARTRWISLADATWILTLIALACLVTGTLLRVWGTAYLGSNIMRGGQLRGERLVGAGPYGYIRNPLYLGTWLLALATTLLMSPTGATVFLVAFSTFLLFLIRTEEHFLRTQLGDTYAAYCRNVPRVWPRLRGISAPESGPHWLRAILDETYPIAFTVCFAIFAWSYNARILVRCLLICYGLSLVVRAIVGAPKPHIPVA